MTDIEQRFGAKFKQPESYHQVYSASAFTFPKMPVISSDDPGSIEFFQWGLIPFWVKDNESVKVIAKFDYKGLFMYHCHILEHEDAGMMGQFEVK